MGVGKFWLALPLKMHKPAFTFAFLAVLPAQSHNPHVLAYTPVVRCLAPTQKHNCIGFLLSVFLFFISSSPAAHATIEPKSWLGGLKTLSAQYEQSLIAPEGHALQNSRGSLSLATAPLGLFIEESWPIHLKVIFDGQFLWQYDVALKQITKHPKERITDAPLLKLFDKPEWSRWTSRSYDGCLESAECFQMIPPQSTTQFKSLIVGFKSNNLRELHILMPTGEQNIYVFKNAIYNGTLAPHLFQFKPPKGVDVL